MDCRRMTGEKMLFPQILTQVRVVGWGEKERDEKKYNNTCVLVWERRAWRACGEGWKLLESVSLWLFTYLLKRAEDTGQKATR